jgi:hypothetical protein
LTFDLLSFLIIFSDFLNFDLWPPETSFLIIFSDFLNFDLSTSWNVFSHHFSVIREIREWAEMGEWAKASITKKNSNRELWCRFESEIRE